MQIHWILFGRVGYMRRTKGFRAHWNPCTCGSLQFNACYCPYKGAYLQDVQLNRLTYIPSKVALLEVTIKMFVYYGHERGGERVKL